MDDSTAIYLVLLLPLFLLLIGINDWAFDYRSDLDRSGILASGMIGLVVFILCFIGKKHQEENLVNNGVEDQ